MISDSQNFSGLSEVKNKVDKAIIEDLINSDTPVPELAALYRTNRAHIYYLARTYLRKDFFELRRDRISTNRLESITNACSAKPQQPELQQDPVTGQDSDSDPVTIIDVPVYDAEAPIETRADEGALEVKTEDEINKAVELLTPAQQKIFRYIDRLMNTEHPDSVPSVRELGQGVFKIRGTHPSNRDTSAARGLWLKMHPEFLDRKISWPGQSDKFGMFKALPAAGPKSPMQLSDCGNDPPVPAKPADNRVTLEYNGCKLSWVPSGESSEDSIIKILSTLSKLTQKEEIANECHE